MKYLLVRDEKSIHDITDRAYKNLSPKAREKAEADLIKTNPELKTFKSVRKGFIVRIPEAVDGGEKNRRNLVDPVEVFAGDMLETLARYEKTLPVKFSGLEQRQNTYAEILKAASKELKTLPNGEAAAKALNAYLADSKKSNEKKLKLGLDALQKLQKTVASMDI